MTATKESEAIEIAKKVLEALKQDRTLRERFFEMIEPGMYVKRDEMTEVLHEIKQLRVESNQRFEAMQKQSDERFKEMQKQMDERFRQSDERFKEMQKQMDERFRQSDERFKEMQRQMDRRFEAMQKQIDERFEKVFARFDELSLALGHDFEEFNSYWLETFLVEQGYPKVRVQKRHFVDNEYTVFAHSKDVEIDLFNEDPFVLGEVTAIVRSIDKVTIFLRKVKFFEKAFERKAEYKLFITYTIVPDIRDEATELLEKEGVTLITLRRPLRKS